MPENASEGSGAPGPERVRLLMDLAACLAAWRRSLAQGVRPSDPSVAGLRGLTGELQAQLPRVGFGGIAFHLGELVKRYDAWGAQGDVREPMDALAHLSEQARLSLSPNEQAQLTRGPGSSVPPAPPPMVTAGGRRGAEGDSRRSHSGVIASGLSSGPESIRPPRLLDSANLGKNEKAAALPPFVGVGVGVQLGRAEGAPQQPMAPPLAAPAPSAPPVGVVRPPSAAPFEIASPPPARPGNAPNLLVRSMLGLRAFGRPAKAGPSVGPEPAPAQVSGEHSASLLGLKRNASSPGFREPSTPPPLLNRSPSGLPPLPPGPALPRPAQHSASSSGSGPRNVQDLLSGIERPRGERRSERPRSGLLRQREEDGGSWRMGAIALAVLALALGGLTTLIIVLTREPDDSGRKGSAPAESAQPAEQSSAAAPEDLPRPKLLNENESFRALIAQVHGRGKESPQLRALVDEHAALAARAVAQKCEGTKAACEEWAKIRESVLGNESVRRVAPRRAAGSPDRVRSRWLVGMKLPDIPVEDDRRVQRSFEFYTENPVGRETFQAMLFRCGAHRDLIQSTLIRHGLPADLLAIVFAESGCEPQATSPVGAAGLWQFMPATARAYHLRVKEGVVDERRSPPKSTEAAVRYLRDLHDKLIVYEKQREHARVWDLVFASYNMGPFALVARIERAGGDASFWDLVDADLLPDETSQYAPAVQAIALILNNLQRLKFAGLQIRAPQITSDLEVAPGTRLTLIARAAATSVNQVRSMNLDISGDVTPDVPNFAVQVPKDVVWQARDMLKELIARGDNADMCVAPDFDWGRQRFSKEMAAACQRRLGSSSP